MNVMSRQPEVGRVDILTDGTTLLVTREQGPCNKHC